MATVTAVKPQKSKKRVNIYLDGKFGFGLDLENFVKLGLKVEQELSEKEIAEIVKKGEFQKTSDKLVRFATLRPRSEKEVNDWLRKKKVHESLHEDLLEKLTNLELLDDEKFANWWVEQRLSFKPRGERVLMAELRQKGIDKGVAESVINKADINEEKIAKLVLEKKAYKWDKYEGFEKRKKLSDFLARKGFGWATINKVVKELVD